MALIDTIRSVVKETLDALKPAAVLTATVEAVDPLKLMVDNRFYLEGAALIVPDIYLPGTITEDHKHIIPPHKTELAFEFTPSEHLHDIEEHEATTITYAGLQVGDTVVVLRNHGGEKFVILGRLV